MGLSGGLVELRLRRQTCDREVVSSTSMTLFGRYYVVRVLGCVTICGHIKHFDIITNIMVNSAFAPSGINRVPVWFGLWWARLPVSGGR